MFRAFSTSATGMAAQQMMIDVTANNLANINTTGFKRSHLNFQDLLYISLQEAGAEISSGLRSPNGMEVGNGVRAVSTIKVFQVGELFNTGNGLDIAILGDGFLQVSMPDGSIKYTRDGSLQKGPDGRLLTTGGYEIIPAITIPTTAVEVSIGGDGGVNITNSDGTQTVVGTLTLARFPNPSGLSSAGENLYSATDGSGTVTTGTAGADGFGLIRSGFLEKSNVQMITELVNLITSQRAYEVNSRAIRAADEMLRKAIQIARF